MSGTKDDTEAEVNRLVDIVVEEVSLVDRAANQHRFLIVKRSDMATENEDGNDTEAARADADTSTNTADSAQTPPAKDQPAKAEAAAMRTAALAALETLTQAVEQLGEGDQDDEPSLAEVARELGAVAQQLAEAAGVDTKKAKGKAAPREAAGEEEEEDDDDRDDKDEEGAAPSRRAPRRKVDDVLASVRELLGQVKDRLAGVVVKADAAGGSPQAPGAADAVVKALAAVNATLKEQGQRLGKLEKRSGLPNSAPTVEGARRTTDDDDHWPLDMNNPLDRASVGKDVSFHAA